ALVAEVTPSSPAATSGIEPGDVITRYDGKNVAEQSVLPMLVASTPVGKTVPVEVVRDGKTKTLEVTVERQAGDEAENDTDTHKAKWGLALRELRPGERAQRNLDSGEGVLMGEVAPDSPAAEAGIKPGDVILQVNRKPVTSVAEVKKEIAAVAAGKPL